MFADYTRSFGNVSIQAGIRYEHVGFDYYEKGKHIDVQSRKFDNIFPSLNINFPIGKTQVQLSYAGDITRPSYDNLRNSTYYANRYTYQTGNPFLTPTMTQNILLAASYQWLNVSVGYSRVKDDMIQISENYSEENPTISLMKVVNTESYDRMTASLTVAAHHRAVETAVHGRALQAVVLHRNPQRHKVTEQPCRYICLAQQPLTACRYTA